MIEKICSRNDHALTISFTEYAGHASVLTQAALDTGADYIIAVGGDGTVNEIARAMLHSRAILGIVPKGSGNGLARELHIPMDSKKALEVILKGNVTTIDCCRANQRVFFCGSYFRYGFHEDAFASAVQCAHAVCGEDPWT